MISLSVPRDDAFDLADAYDAHASELFGFAVNALRDRGAAEECVQEVFLRVWRSRERYDPDRASIRTWLFAIMRNVVLDKHRARAREPQTVDHERAQEVPGHNPDPTLRLTLLQALATLSPEHRQAVVGIHLVGLAHAELAQALDVPVATLRTRTFYGLRALRTYLDEGEADHGSPHA